MNLYAVSNGQAYSDRKTYVFTTSVGHAVIEALVFKVNEGRRFEKFEILAGAEILVDFVRPEKDAFAVFLDDLWWNAGFDEDGEPRDVVSSFPGLVDILTEYKARTRKAKK